MAFIFSATMTLLMLAIIGFICVDFFADFANDPMPFNARQEKTIQETYGPFISEFLGLNFQGQYAPKYGKNARPDSYRLTAEDRQSAIQQLQHVFRNSDQVSLEVTSVNEEQKTISERFWLSYDGPLAEELCSQVEFAEDTFISPLDYKYIPDVVLTFHPSELRINMMAHSPVPSAHFPFVYLSLGQGMQRWEGFFGYGLTAAILDAQLTSGETVHACISDRLPAFP